MKKNNKKLVLHRETLQGLERNEIKKVKGAGGGDIGQINPSDPIYNGGCAISRGCPP